MVKAVPDSRLTHPSESEPADAFRDDRMGEWGLRPIQVLLVDDDEVVLRAYGRTLQRMGYEVALAGDGPSAEALLEGRRFDVVVSDIGLPGLDGLQLLRAIRQRDLDVPVILVTGEPSVQTAADAVEFGALRYLVKPVDPEELRKAVRHAARLHHIARLKRQALALGGEGGPRLVGDRAALEASFEHALDTLWMAYQPVVSWSDRSTFAFESLLRAAEPSLPQPGMILEAAERLGRLSELGRTIRDRVAADMAGTPHGIFVNVTAQDLADPHLHDPAAALSRLAGRVTLEITERTALDAVADVKARIAQLRQLGYAVAIDDLGAGYAGLSAFAQLEPQVVKLDMTLVRGLNESRTRTRLVRSLYEAFRDLEILVIAEGVETAEERDALAALGADLMQGYHFAWPGRPFPGVSWPAAPP
jgi:EAL domain-containing protein (putative c-di-GMP-specific phosphodiesterase class I)